MPEIKTRSWGFAMPACASAVRKASHIGQEYGEGPDNETVKHLGKVKSSSSIDWNAVNVLGNVADYLRRTGHKGRRRAVGRVDGTPLSFFLKAGMHEYALEFNRELDLLGAKR
jgi:hypothetical protein